jgi:hypothetical protein
MPPGLEPNWLNEPVPRAKRSLPVLVPGGEEHGQAKLNTPPQNKVCETVTHTCKRHPGGGRDPDRSSAHWIPTFAGMTNRISDIPLCDVLLSPWHTELKPAKGGVELNR